MKPGDTIKSHHLLVICSDSLPDGSVLAFNLTSRDWDSDQTCVVKVAEHPYVVRDSVIAYRFGELLTPRHIARLQLLAPKEYGPVSPQLLLRIQEGAIKSDQTPAYRRRRPYRPNMNAFLRRSVAWLLRITKIDPGRVRFRGCYSFF